MLTPERAEYLRSRCRAEVSNTIGKVHALIGKEIFPVFPTIEFFTTSLRRAGSAIPFRNLLQFNLKMMDLYEEVFCSQTIPHEVAHLVVHKICPFAKSHGKEWRAVMQRLGLVPLRCHDYKIPITREDPRKFIYSCDCGDRGFTAIRHRRSMRAPEGSGYRCLICHKILVFNEQKTLDLQKKC